MSLGRRTFLASCVGVVLGARPSAAQAGRFMNGIVDNVFAAASPKISGTLEVAFCLLIGGIAIAVPVLLLKELVEWLHAEGPVSVQVRMQFEALRMQLASELKLPSDTPSEEIVRELVRLEKVYEPKLLEKLDPNTRDRFAQVRRQLQGTLAMIDDGVANQLQLSPAQRNALRAIADEREAAAREAIGQDRPLLTFAQLAAKKRMFDSRARAVLALDQQALWTKLAGAPISPPVLR